MKFIKKKKIKWSREKLLKFVKTEKLFGKNFKIFIHQTLVEGLQPTNPLQSWCSQVRTIRTILKKRVSVKRCCVAHCSHEGLPPLCTLNCRKITTAWEGVVEPPASYNGVDFHFERDLQARIYRSGENGGEHRQGSCPIQCVASFPYQYVSLQPRPPQSLRVLRCHCPPQQRRCIILLRYLCLFYLFPPVFVWGLRKWRQNEIQCQLTRHSWILHT